MSGEHAAASVVSFECHLNTCSICHRAASPRTACPEGRRLHEAMVRAAQTPEWTLASRPGQFASLPIADAQSGPPRAGQREVFADVSGWQGSIDWNAYASAYARASIKATEGIGFTDPRYGDNEAGTRAAGIQRVHYHFARPDLNPADPEGEADWFWAVAGPRFQAADAAELDFEQDAGVDLEGWKSRWLARIATYTSRYGMYSGGWFLNPRGVSWGPGFTHDASYGGAAPATDLWQYTDAGNFPGISGGVDANQVLNPAVFAPPTPIQEDTMILLVNTPKDGVWLLSGSLYANVSTPTVEQSFMAAGVKTVTIDESMHLALIAASVSGMKPTVAGTFSLTGGGTIA